MAARKRRVTQTQKTKDLIGRTQLEIRLMNHILADGGLLTASQVTAALGLLKKYAPDLAHTTGEMQHTVVDDLTERLMEARKNAEASRKTLN